MSGAVTISTRIIISIASHPHHYDENVMYVGSNNSCKPPSVTFLIDGALTLNPFTGQAYRCETLL
eukprot:3318286-Karenia_brevis.AAC.1